MTGLHKLHAQTTISMQSLRTLIKLLKSTNEITTYSTSKYSIFTVVNYDNYQINNIQINTQSTHNQQSINNQDITDDVQTEKALLGNRQKSTSKSTVKSTSKSPIIDDGKPTSTSTSKLTINQQSTNNQLTTNKNDKNFKNDKKKNILPKHKHGEYGHVLLNDDEVAKLKTRLDFPKWLKTLDENIEMKGYKYLNHYLAMMNWARRDGQLMRELTPAEQRHVDKMASAKAAKDLAEAEFSKLPPEEQDRRIAAGAEAKARILSSFKSPNKEPKCTI